MQSLLVSCPGVNLLELRSHDLAACASEVFKMATSCSPPLNNYMVFNDTAGIYTYEFEAERRVNTILYFKDCCYGYCYRRIAPRVQSNQSR